MLALSEGQLDWEKGWLNWRWALPVISLSGAGSPFHGTSRTPFSKSTPSAQSSGQRTTWHQSLGQTAEVRIDTTHPGPVSFSKICSDTLISLHWLLVNCRMIRPVSSNDLRMCKCSKERLSEEQVRKHLSERQKRTEMQKWETISLEKGMRKRSCFGYYGFQSCFRSGDWAVPACIWLYNVSQHYPVTWLSLKLGVGSSSCNQIIPWTW